MLKVSKVDARLTNVPIRKFGQVETAAALIMLINMVADFYNTELPEPTKSIIVDDILELYGWMSIIEIAKAFTEGRRSSGDLYGKLSGKHILNWIHEYDQSTQMELHKVRQMEKIEINEKMNGIPQLQELADKMVKGVIDEEHRDKLKMAEARKELNEIFETHKDRAEYSRQWTPQMGDYQTYMENYDGK